MGQGYTPGTIRNMLKDLGQVGLWLSSVGLTADQLNEEGIAAFRAARQAAGRVRIPGTRAMAPLLTYLRANGVAAQAQPSMTPLAVVVAQYRDWMVTERGLAPTTVLRYENTARRFLREQAVQGQLFAPASLSGLDINAFLLRECGRVSAGSGRAV